jgi:pyridoxine kinase
MPVLSIQSHVAMGHIGNSAAVFALQRLGIEVWPVHTVQLSNHTGFADWGGGAMDVAHVADVLAGLERRGAYTKADAILTGYMGSPELVGVVADAVARAKAANPALLYCCDPVIGNGAKGLFVAEPVAAAIRELLLPLADLATPNAFELRWLSGADDARQLGPARVAVTSVETAAGTGAMLLDGEAAWLVETPRLDVPGNGAGDTFCALLLGHLLRGAAPEDALSLAVSSVHALLRKDGLALVAAQDEIVAPSQVFTPEKIS